MLQTKVLLQLKLESLRLCGTCTASIKWHFPAEKKNQSIMFSKTVLNYRL